VKYFAIALAAALLGSCGSPNIDNQEAVRAAMVEYIQTKGNVMGLDPNAMDVRVDAVTFERDTARATVSFVIKGTDQGMHMNYTLTRQGNKWGNVQKQSAMTGPHGIDDTPAAAPTEKGSERGKEALLPVPLPGTQPSLPAGHPPVDPGAK
jgi:hypothetical protein